MNQKILEVLIPTYRRPQKAIGAIDSVLSGADSRVGVFCHSNGSDPEIEAAIASRPALRYGYFPENRGAVANFRKILEDSCAEYVLFLSDEDRIDPKLLADFTDFLSSGHHGFVLCSVVEDTGANYFSLAALHGETISFEDLLVLFPIDPTYMSGYCFRRDLLTDELIHAAFEDDEANVYPHLILRNSIASCAGIGLFTPNMVIKGAEANIGGDSHSHLEGGTAAVQATGRQPLNPHIYGEGARARQLCYLAPRLNRDLAQVSRFRRAFAKLYVLSAWLKITSDAHLHVETSAAVVTLEAAIKELLRQNGGARGLVGSYCRVLSIRQAAFRTMIITLMWKLTKSVKLVLFIQRFGMFRTLAFIKGKHA